MKNQKYQRQRDRERSREKRRRDDRKNSGRDRERESSGKWRGWKQHRERDNKRQEVQNKKYPLNEDINRDEVCPFLVRVFFAVNNQNSVQALPEDREVRLYLWMNSSLKQITELLRAHLPNIRTKQKFIFYRVHEEIGKDNQRQMTKKEMGVVIVHKKSEKGEGKTLAESRFCIGDYIDVSINYK